MGLSGFRAISWMGLGWVGLGWDLCAGLFYDHRFAMLIINEVYRRLARHSPRAEANIVKACNTMQWSHKIS